MRYRHREHHRLGTVGWLRAAVLGANDGIVSISSLILGVASSHATHHTILMTGVASLVAGAMSMATGEYVSVQSQADTEQAALATEKLELRDHDASEHQELASIYVARGLTRPLATEVADQLMARDALGAHARDELGITGPLAANPLNAAIASALSFITGALLPLLVAFLVPAAELSIAVVISSLLCLGALGGLAAQAGGARVGTGMLRVTFWSALAMGVTAGIGALLGTVA